MKSEAADVASFASDFTLAGLKTKVVLLANPVHSSGLSGGTDDFSGYHGGTTLRAAAACSGRSLLAQTGASGFTDFLSHGLPPFRYKKTLSTGTWEKWLLSS